MESPPTSLLTAMANLLYATVWFPADTEASCLPPAHAAVEYDALVTSSKTAFHPFPSWAYTLKLEGDLLWQHQLHRYILTVFRTILTGMLIHTQSP
jgi:hypothetical protein